MIKKIKIGVFGAYRGISMIDFCLNFPETELVAICDKFQPALDNAKKIIDKHNLKVSLYTTFDEFIKHDMDAVVLANYANEHAPFAVKCLNSGRHVISEVLPAQNMAEAVALCEAVEKSGKIYAYAENYCYFTSVYEMKKLYDEGKIGKFEYGEGEYVHDCESIWPEITYGDRNHWRNNMHANYYCTHSLGPIIHITRLRPKSVIGFELPIVDRMKNLGSKSGAAGIEMVTLENGAVIKSLHCLALKRNPHAIWYCVYGDKGMAESGRLEGGVSQVTTFVDEKFTTFEPQPILSKDITKDISAGHGGSDFYPIYYFIQKILGKEGGENSIDLYEALDMWMPGHFAYKSVCNGNISFEIPDLTKKENREIYRNDTWCTDKNVAKDMLAPSYSKGNPEIPEEVYDKVKIMYKEFLEKQN